MLTDIIPEMMTSVNLPPEKKAPDPDNLSRADRRGYDHLEYKYLYWKGKGGLEKDGSFFLSSKDFARGIRVLPRAIRRLKKRLRASGLVRYKVTKGYRGTTYYWLAVNGWKEILKTPEQPQERPALDPENVRAMVRIKGKDWVLSCEAFKAYTKAEIEGCFED